MLWRVSRRVEDINASRVPLQPWRKFLLYILSYLATQFPCAVWTIIEWFMDWRDENERVDILWVCVVAQQLHGFANGLIYGLSNNVIYDQWSNALRSTMASISGQLSRMRRTDPVAANELLPTCRLEHRDLRYSSSDRGRSTPRSDIGSDGLLALPGATSRSDGNGACEAGKDSYQHTRAI